MSMHQFLNPNCCSICLKVFGLLWSVGACSSQFPRGLCLWGFSYTNLMDADQGRCRRTDGKRWRCSNDVVVDEKYCERHMHRGAGNRSRKLVEDPKIVCTSDPAANIQPRSHYVEKPKSIASTSVPGRLKLKIPSPNCTIPRSGKDTTILTITSTKTPITASTRTPTAAFVTTPTATATISTSSDKRMKRNCENGMDNEGKDTHVDTGIDRENSSGNSSSVSKASAKLGFSSNSSLEAVGGISLCYNHKNITETETWRCRRTDGKKWRCKNAVIPCQKYCAQHMFRGTKKHAGSSQFIAAAATM